MTSIPIVDLRKLSVDSVESPQVWNSVAEDIRKALHHVGFTYLINHGVPSELITEYFAISKQFFELPLEVKQQYKKTLEESRNGWVEPGQELLHEDSKFEYRECFDITTRKRIFPKEIPSFYGIHQKMELHCAKLIRVVLRLLAISLKLEDEDYFINRCCHLNTPEIENECDFSMIFYPPILEDTTLPPDTVRCAEHTDYEIMTFLFQNQVGGLEIKTSDGKWISADPLPNTILVNTGDLLEMWTNKYYKATLHRVIIPKTEKERRQARYSFAYFIAPDSETLVRPLTSTVISAYVQNKLENFMEHKEVKDLEETKPKESKQSPITAYDHIIKRVNTAYGVTK